jgi:hypothetical protein
MIDTMPRKKQRTASKRFPSRENTKYVGIPRELWDILDGLAESDERSVAYFAKKYIREGLERDGKLPKK